MDTLRGWEGGEARTKAQQPKGARSGYVHYVSYAQLYLSIFKWKGGF